MSDPEEVEVEVTEEVEEEPEFVRPAGVEETAEDTSMEDAVAAYKKIFETKELTDDERTELDKKVKEMEQREIVDTDPLHEAVEIPLAGKGKIAIGPPTLTRFEKARILGSRALQISVGAPFLIKLSDEDLKNIRYDPIEIAKMEFEKGVVPITVKRPLPILKRKQKV